jgi:ribonuclease E
MFTKSIFTVSALAFAVAFGATAQAQQGPAQAAAQGGATRQIVVEAAKDAGADQAKAPDATGAIEKAEAPLKQGEVKQAPPVVEKLVPGGKPVVAEKAPVVAEKAPVVAEKAPVVVEKAPVVEKQVVVETPVVVKKPHYGYSGYGYRRHHCD